MAVAEEVRASLADGFRDELIVKFSRKMWGDGAAEHVEPGVEAVLAIFEWSGTIKEEDVGDFEPMALKPGRVFGDARVIPGTGEGLRLAERLPSAA